MKYIFTDVDGTIFDKKTIITKELRNDFIFAGKQGYNIIIATGNPIFSKMK
jgi:hydroxymethylpyrimidine pyrophosphatase-like HAD family hydrolase